MTGDLRVQTNRDELSRFIGDSRPARGRESRPGHLLLQAVEGLGVGLQNLVGLGVADPVLIHPAVRNYWGPKPFRLELCSHERGRDRLASSLRICFFTLSIIFQLLPLALLPLLP